MIKLSYRWLSLIFILLATVTFADPLNGTQSLDKVVAIVNDDIITQSQLTAMMNDMQHSQISKGQPPLAPADLKKQALDQLINITMQLQIAKRNKVTATDAQVTQVMNHIAQQNHLTPDQLKQAIIKQGTNYKTFRQQIHDQLVVHQLQQSIFSNRIKITDEEIKAYLKNTPAQLNPDAQYHVDDLLIPLDESTTPAQLATAQQTAQTLLAKAKTGVSFQQLADNDKTLTRTDLGWRKAADLPAVFVTAVSGMKAGGFKGPIRAPNGLHLIQLVEIQGTPGKTLTFNEARDLLFQQKVKAEIDKWLLTVRNSAYVKIMP